MIIHEMEQGTPEWLAARLGIPTASEMSRIITPAKGDLSKQCKAYAHQLVAETLLGRPLEKPPGDGPWAMRRGKELEPLARAQYARDNKIEIRTVGLVTTNDGRVGASPDALIIGERGGLEIKAVLDANHVGIWADGPGDDYKCQVQCSLAVCELAWWDLYAWHPNLPPVTRRFVRDESFITKMNAALIDFLAIRDELLARAEASSWKAREAEALPATFGAMKIAA